MSGETKKVDDGVGVGDEVVHLFRNVCDGCAMWCEGDVEGKKGYENAEVPENEDGVRSISKATCLKCLETACAFGDAVRKRLLHIS